MLLLLKLSSGFLSFFVMLVFIFALFGLHANGSAGKRAAQGIQGASAPLNPNKKSAGGGGPAWPREGAPCSRAESRQHERSCNFMVGGSSEGDTGAPWRRHPLP